MTALETEISRIMGAFAAAGAERFEAQALQPADVLLDLYGEDIRARAFTTREGAQELMLRPDFTVPVVQRHMSDGAAPARYCYAGPVWRKQGGTTRPREYLQCGIELFDTPETDPAETDAEAFALIAEILAGRGLQVAIGDMGILLAAIDALDTTEARRAALRRHLWRPSRFHRLLERFSNGGERRAFPLDVEAAILARGQPFGKRGVAEVMARVERLRAEAETPPLTPGELALIEALLDLSGPAGTVLEQLRRLNAPAEAVERFARRLAALEARGIDAAALPFEAASGRTTLEYYDGFVFGFYAAGREDLPVVASGGRYDALTRVLGGGRGIHAVGGIIRPQALLALEAA